MSDSSFITREQLLAFMGQTPDTEGTVALVGIALAQMGWGDRQQFSQTDVVDLMATVTGLGKEAVLGSDAPDVQAQRDHLVPLLDALELHAFPVLKAMA